MRLGAKVTDVPKNFLADSSWPNVFFDEVFIVLPRSARPTGNLWLAISAAFRFDADDIEIDEPHGPQGECVVDVCAHGALR